MRGLQVLYQICTSKQEYKWNDSVPVNNKKIVHMYSCNSTTPQLMIPLLFINPFLHFHTARWRRRLWRQRKCDVIWTLYGVITHILGILRKLGPVYALPNNYWKTLLQRRIWILYYKIKEYFWKLNPRTVSGYMKLGIIE